MSGRVEQQLGELNHEVVRLYGQGMYEQAIGFAKQSCDLARLELGEADPAFATSLNNLGPLHHSMGTTRRPSRSFARR